MTNQKQEQMSYEEFEELIEEFMLAHDMPRDLVEKMLDEIELEEKPKPFEMPEATESKYGEQ